MKTIKLFSTLAIVAFTAFQANAQVGFNATNNSGTYATALGRTTVATGYASTALGEKTTASGSRSLASGFWSAASGHYSFALGTRTIAQNSHAMALGIDVRATSNRSMIFGTGVGNGISNAMINDIPNSLMVGFNSTKPTLFVGSSNGGSTIGKVGIGTTDPQSELHVHDGTIRLTGNTFAGGPMILFGENGQTTDNGQWGIEYVPVANSPKPGLNFWRPWPNTNFGNHFLFLSDTGKVAVGTDNTPTSIGGANISAYRFFVKGGMLAEEVRVRTGWADYVFADDYNLKPLAEVEAFIKENKHLPNVPSANTVETQGIELGDISRIQQEKIEELTLYIIDQQKQIDELKTLVNGLTDKNNN
jgi:hypothetical protein